jgi:EAL domain-containing protein (putative c-di-GMP-specific phosphodiesterase class I)
VLRADVHTTASIGIAVVDRGDHLPEELLHDADVAMYQAKRKGGARHQVIDLGEQRAVDQRSTLLRDLRHACEGGELRMEYQPIVRTVDGRIVGVEALLRWAHPSRGLVSPAMLIPLAEQSGLIAEIGQWMLKQACQDLRRWRDHHHTDDLGVSVNVSAHQLLSLEFTATVEEVLLSTGTAAGLLTLEVTESVFARDSERAVLVLNDLKRLGVMLALDDFGAGSSSLGYLSLFPVDLVKMGPGFASSLEQEKATHAIVSAVVELAHTLRLTVGAKGVETMRQHDDVATLGCDACQGYYFARPMPAEAFDALMGHRVAGGNPRLPLLASAS